MNRNVRIANELVKLAKSLVATDNTALADYLNNLGWKIDKDLATKELGDNVEVTVNVGNHAKMVGSKPQVHIDFIESHFRSYEELQTLVNAIESACSEVENFNK